MAMGVQLEQKVYARVLRASQNRIAHLFLVFLWFGGVFTRPDCFNKVSSK